VPEHVQPLIAVENAFVGRVYQKLARVYDVAFGPILQAGRRRAIARMRLTHGARVLDVGVGTGANLPLYPAHCHVTGVDFSPHMLERARVRLARLGRRNTRLSLMDAAHLQFADNSFDVVYAAYTVSVVPDPIRVVSEMRRVCRRGGRIVMLSHFGSANPIGACLERWIAPLTVHIGFHANLGLEPLLEGARLRATSIEKVNIPPIWSLVVCEKP
jgi:phosphatidylethanolamine/phosphatidyl-N-methylethanolamine N-methyltransferase